MVKFDLHHKDEDWDLSDYEDLELEALTFDGEDDEESDDLEFDVKARKKKKVPLTMEQACKEKIKRYNNYRNVAKFENVHPFMRNRGLEQETGKYKSLFELAGVVRLCGENYINLSTSEGKEVFVLMPDCMPFYMKQEVEVHLIVDEYDDCYFFVEGILQEKYEENRALFEKAELEKKLEMIKAVKRDPEGVNLWKELGEVKRDSMYTRALDYPRLVFERAEEMYMRLEREDLCESLQRAYCNAKHCHFSDKNDMVFVLDHIERLISIAASEPQDIPSGITQEDLGKYYPHANIKEGPASKRERVSPPNIMIVGKDYKSGVHEMVKDGHRLSEIEMYNVHDDSYLLGEAISYRGYIPGRLIEKIEEQRTFSMKILLSNVDLMGHTGRACDPVLGIAGFLRTHKINNQFLSGFDIDAKATQFICQVADINACPEEIRNEMDIIVEL